MSKNEAITKYANLVTVLTFIQDLLDRNGVQWVLVGSLSLAIQGVDVEVHDIDIANNGKGAVRCGELLKEFVESPVEWSEGSEFASYFGQFSIEGVTVEIMGNLHAWEYGQWRDISKRLRNPIHITIGDILVPVSSLKDQLDSYRKSNREKDYMKADAIERVLKKRML